MSIHFAKLAPLFALSLMLVACAPTDIQGRFPFTRLAPMAPPDPQDEAVQRPEEPMNEIWRPGYWDYDGVTFTWISGALVQRPDPTAVWAPDRWEQRSFGWAFIPGTWQ